MIFVVFFLDVLFVKIVMFLKLRVLKDRVDKYFFGVLVDEVEYELMVKVKKCGFLLFMY